MNNIKLLSGDCLLKLKELETNSIDSIVTDPPYGLAFMGKKWDYEVPNKEIWAECLRVLKPGGHLLSFGGTRTYHRLVVNIEDAGFEIRDCIQWLYGSGFPKSMDVGKQIDKQDGYVGEVLSVAQGAGQNAEGYKTGSGGLLKSEYEIRKLSDKAQVWQGWGSALKPANEPICVARKPLEKGLTLAENVQKWGCGGINIDASRIGKAKGDRTEYGVNGIKRKTGNVFGEQAGVINFDGTQGRWPANIILDEEASGALDAQAGDNVSRFFYCAKASKKDRGADNNHPTVKPIKLMEYLIKLVTPPNGTVLDPFMGSGSTGVAAKCLGFSFVGCELDESYLKISENRISSATKESDND